MPLPVWRALRLLSAVFLLLITLPDISLSKEQTVSGLVKEVIDGDTVVLSSGETLRYIGIDTPEAGELFYEEAKTLNRDLVRGKEVSISVCGKPRDKYGRLLVWVWADGVLVNEAILKKGLARTLFIPPCGLESKALFASIQKEAKEKGLGIWGKAAAIIEVSRTVTARNASRYIGKYIGVSGVVKGVREGKGALYLDFEDSGGFTAVIFKKTLPRFRGASLDPARLKGRQVLVTGVISEYRGHAEMILSGPGQIREQR